MHPKAAQLTLAGFSLFASSSGSREWWIKREYCPSQPTIVLGHRLDSARLTVTQSNATGAACAHEWNQITAARWMLIPQQLIEELIHAP